MDTTMEAKRRLQARKKKFRRQERIKKICIASSLVAIGIAIFVCIYFPFREVSFDGMVLTRDLAGSGIFIQDLPSEMPNMAWADDLPNFIERDLRWLEKKNENCIIKYTFGEEYITISKQDGSYEFSVSDWSPLVDVSIYEEDGKLLVYGKNNLDYFVRYIISETDFVRETLSLDYKHIPVNICDSEKDVSWRIGEYAVLVKDDVFYFYQNGKLVSESIFYDEIEMIYPKYSMVYTKNKLLYGIYVYLDQSVPQVTTRIIDQDVEIPFDWTNSTDLRMYENDTVTYLPIVLKDGEYYTYVPEWKSYQAYNMEMSEEKQFSNLEDDTNLDRNILKVADAFFSAVITFDKYYGWQADFLFDMGTLSNPKYFEISDYKIRGYDNFQENT